jgi:hypothetical protein
MPLTAFPQLDVDLPLGLYDGTSYVARVLKVESIASCNTILLTEELRCRRGAERRLLDRARVPLSSKLYKLHNSHEGSPAFQLVYTSNETLIIYITLRPCFVFGPLPAHLGASTPRI